MGITLEELKMNAALPINPTIIRIMRVLRIARVLKLLKMATGMRALLDTVMQALPQVGNLGLLFMLLFFIYAALGVELFGKLECNDDNPCEGLSRHATFENFGMAFLTLFRVSTGDNWNGIMKDTLRECRPEDRHCLTYLPLVSPLYFVTFVLMAQFVLVNVVVAVLMKHLEESNKEAKEDAEMDAEIALEMEMERQRRLSTGSNNSSVGGTYVGPRPNSPGQEEEVQCTDRDLLSPRKMSVSRMHSLPNDSYMFQPVRPASAPYPVEELDLSPQHHNSGMFEPCGSSSPHVIPSPRALRRQVAVKLDSVESQGCDQQQLLQERPDPSAHLPPPCPSPISLPPLSPPLALLLLPPPPSSPLPLSPPPVSPRSLPRPASLRRPRPCPPVAVAPGGGQDPTDEEVSHITSSALNLHWGAGAAQEQRRPRPEGGGAKVCRSHSLSPYASPFSFDSCAVPLPPLPPPPAAGGTLGLPTERGSFRKRRPTIEPLPPLPGYHDDHRRHSIGICLAPPPGHHHLPAAEGERGRRGFPVRVQSVGGGGGGGRHKKRLSPPCISIHPPAPVAPPPAPPPPTPPLSCDRSSTLRRRTLLLSPTGPGIFIQLHAPPVPGSPSPAFPLPPPLPQHSPSPTAQRSSPLAGDYMPLPRFTFDQSEAVYNMSGLSVAGIPDGETGSSCPSSPFDSRLEDRAGFSTKNRRTAQ
ncbi:hypothetical protein CRUP_014714 [Coryphaenoides rupestris]|nr:hypothetical protein CRUP_014714 [Coryphaenoides rupestris]